MEEGHRSSFILLEAHQKPLRISHFARQTSLSTSSRQAGVSQIPRDSPCWQAPPGSERPCPFFRENFPRRVTFAWMWDRERRGKAGNLLSLQPCPLVVTCGQSPRGAAGGGEHRRADVRTRWSRRAGCPPLPAARDTKAALRLEHSPRWEHGEQHL